MSIDTMRLIVLILVATFISSFGDVQGFVHAAKMWQNDGSVIWDAMGRSALGFLISMIGYWFSTKYLIEFGIFAPEAQVLVWLGVTIVGVALISREFFTWPIADQFVAFAVVAGIGWLLFRTAA